MSNMSFMEKLLDGVEVEWKSLGEVGEFIRGNGMQKKDFIETGFPAIHYGQIYTRYGLSADKTFTYISEDLANKLRKANKNDLLLATTSENDEDVVKPLAWLGGEAVISGDMMLFRHDQDVKYLAYYFQTEAFQTQKRKYINGAKVRRVSKDDLAKIVVPIPKKLDIQTEIVRILDTFTELTAKLTAKLTAEFTARKKQYNYYRDQLLSFEKGEVEWKTLGEIGEFIRGKRFTKADYVEHGISVIHYGEIYTQYGVSTSHVLSKVSPEMATTLRYAEPGDVVITDVGETVEDVGKAVAWIGNERVAIHDHCYAFRHAMNPKFVSYCMQTTPFIAEKAKYVARTKVNTLLINGFAKISIPVPPIEEQNRLVGILDKFDALTSSISEGLPREIELRQKQYEYYRDLLLSFPKPEVEA
ncbi:restriction endonuclease subunit S [Photorhabdus namnaonensis]|uniref:Putative type-1 restriction enzyme specificity protein n=1 Tax=Photorhabdus namnaonensis TaxID=1851568 RepID=A0A1B8YJ07_9GAMM|nr:restriction endonuclease subunit S [Photorhabdus namnaonensis]OCA55124.1 putative type-1 restriction enzyme specificity protein [Photorhabdus namnaonensis]